MALSANVAALAKAVADELSALRSNDVILTVGSFAELQGQQVDDLLIFNLGGGKESAGLYVRQPNGHYRLMKPSGRTIKVPHHEENPMRPRWQVAFLLLTLPIWFIPGMIYIGWVEAGRDVITQDIPLGLKWVFTGKKPRGY